MTPGLRRRGAGANSRAATALALGWGLVLALATHAAARPTYFEVATSTYGIGDDSRLYGCGICHKRWTGTGQRNPFGLAVQQHLYAGKTINQALAAVESLDSDGDGVTHVAELSDFRTVPGFSCANFEDAVGFVSGFDSYVTPAVATCLDPIDLDLSTAAWSFVAYVGQTSELTLELINHGAQLPIAVSSVELLAGAHASLSIASSPSAPFSIPVGERAAVTLRFAPTAAVFATATLRVTSDDPDEPVLDVTLSGIGVPRVLAALETRRTCRAQVDGAFARYSRSHLKEWTRCASREAQGLDCGAAQRDFRIAQAQAALRGVLGGALDRSCQGAGLTPGLAGYDAACSAAGSCASRTVSGFASLAECLICRQDEATNQLLDAAIGAMPPDLPTTLPPGDGLCLRRLLPGVERAVGKLRATLATCELESLDADPAIDCAAATADDAAHMRDTVAGLVTRCGTPAAIAGCEFGPDAVPGCLGDAATTAATALVP